MPEIALHLADDVLALWRRLADGAATDSVPLPFWAAAWPGGLALARYLLDHPEVVRRRRVLDIASGSGLVALAAARAAAATVTANDLDPVAIAAIALNAAANGLSVETLPGDVLDGDGRPHDLILVGDACYEPELAQRMLRFIGRVRARRARLLIADPERWYLPEFFPRDEFAAVRGYQVPVIGGIEDSDRKDVTVWQPRSASAAGSPSRRSASP